MKEFEMKILFWKIKLDEAEFHNILKSRHE